MYHSLVLEEISTYVLHWLTGWPLRNIHISNVHRHFPLFGFLSSITDKTFNKLDHMNNTAGVLWISGADPGGAPGARPPKIGKNKIFWCKTVIFHMKYPKNFRASLRNWIKNNIFWRKIVIFHTKYPKNVRAFLRSAQFF